DLRVGLAPHLDLLLLADQGELPLPGRRVDGAGGGGEGGEQDRHARLHRGLRDVCERPGRPAASEGPAGRRMVNVARSEGAAQPASRHGAGPASPPSPFRPMPRPHARRRTLLLLVAIALTACGRDRADLIDRETFVAVYVDLRVAGLRTPDGVLPDTTRA